MLVYVAHCYMGNPKNIERAKKITHDLQVQDTENCYICPLTAFSHLAYKEIGFNEEMALCLDLLSVCDKLIVASETISKGMNEEIEFCHLIGMEVEYLED